MHNYWYQIGIKHVKDIYDYGQQVFIRLVARPLDLPSADCLKYFSLLQAKAKGTT